MNKLKLAIKGFKFQSGEVNLVGDLYTDRWDHYYIKFNGRLITPFELRRRYTYTMTFSYLMKLAYKDSIIDLVQGPCPLWEYISKQDFKPWGTRMPAPVVLGGRGD